MTELPRVAVLGVPRSGTSMAVGLLRILGFRLPPAQYAPICEYGEAHGLRANDESIHRIKEGLATLPPGTVWKDPMVGSYIDQLDLSGWKVIIVDRKPEQTIESEKRWTGVAADHSDWSDRLRNESGHYVTFDEMRNDPKVALLRLRLELIPMATTRMRAGERTAEYDRAAEFIQNTHGYRCPLPDTCELEHTK